MKYVLIASFAVFSFSAFSQQNICLENVKKHIYYLASDSMKGRHTGDEGQKKAADYIANEFRSAGLVPAGNCTENQYYQRFCIYYPKKNYAYISSDTTRSEKRYKQNVRNKNEKYPLVFNSDAYSNGIEFLYISNGTYFNDKVRTIVKAGDVTGNDTSVAVLIEAKTIAEAKQVIEKLYKEKSVRSFFVAISGRKFGKIVDEYPDGRFLFGKENGKESFYKLGMLKPKKLKLPSEIFYFNEFCRNNKGCEIVLCSPKFKRALLEKNKASAQFRYSVFCSRLWDSTVTENVAGLLEGKSKDLIVVGAHYDHVGAYGNEINNGADDNASGTTGVLEIAREMSENAAKGNVPQKSVLFIAFTAEEEGLIGSEAFHLNNRYPDRQIDFMVNMDMIGRNDKRNDTLSHYTYCLPFSVGKSRIRRMASEASTGILNRNIVNKPDIANRILYRFGSDHHGFARRGIPSVVFFTGLHADYHKPGDDPEKIWYTNCTEIIKVVCGTIYKISEMK